MGTAVFLWSWTPLTIAVTGGSVGPFMFVLLTAATGIPIWLIHLLRYHRELTLNKQTWKTVTKLLRTRDGLYAVLVGFDIALFVAATQYIDTTIVAIVVACYPILFIKQLKNHNTTYQPLTTHNWATITTAAAGAALVILSQNHHLTTHNKWWHLPTGLTLATGSMILTSWLAYRFKLGKQLHQHTPTTNPNKLACVLIISVAGSLTHLTLLTPLALLTKPETIPTHHILLILLLGAAGGTADILFRHANLTTKNLGINTLEHTQPILALTWLTLFTTNNVTHPTWLTIGAAGIIAANLLIHTKPKTP